ncbi:MAG: hypothetical protein KatS3mg031_2446 [Chitinophagales bacterium]|nr:MAG: hypothetical protein KatS3mg031_2446 [Chitinophagales bacterium]
MNRAIRLMLLLSVVLAGSSCKTTRKATVRSGSLPALDSVLAVLSNQPAYVWFAAKARVTYIDESGTKNFTAHIRMRKDSIIWVSATTMLGLEAARLMIRPDSVFFLDRFNKTYYTGAPRLPEHIAIVPFNFNMSWLERIITGGLMPFQAPPHLKASPNHLILEAADSDIMQRALISPSNLWISTQYLIEKQTGRSLELVFDDYQVATDRLFSFSRKVKITNPAPITLLIKFSKVNWDEPQQFPFHISEAYEKF